MSTLWDFHCIIVSMYVLCYYLFRRRKYLSLSEEEAQKCDTLRNQIDKDVVRTDRLVQYYKDENNTHLSILL